MGENLQNQVVENIFRRKQSFKQFKFPQNNKRQFKCTKGGSFFNTATIHNKGINEYFKANLLQKSSTILISFNNSTNYWNIFDLRGIHAGLLFNQTVN